MRQKDKKNNWLQLKENNIKKELKFMISLLVQNDCYAQVNYLKTFL